MFGKFSEDLRFFIFLIKWNFMFPNKLKNVVSKDFSHVLIFLNILQNILKRFEPKFPEIEHVLIFSRFLKCPLYRHNKFLLLSK